MPRMRYDVAETVLIEGEPWLLGFCRWGEEIRCHAGDLRFTVERRSGRWRWRGLQARWRETTLATSGPGEIHTLAADPFA